jgi:RecA-family ATPase
MVQHDFAPHDSVCLFFGQNDTRAPTIICRKTGETKLNPHPAAGQPYGAIDFQAIRKLIADPASKPKEEAPAIIPSRFIGPWARNHATQKEAGRFIWSCFDIDKGDPSLENVRRVFEEVFPDAAKLIYSTSSATADDKRWRVLMPMVEVGGEDFVKIQRAAFELIEGNGLMLDKALDRCGQPVYLPNVPPAKRDKDGKPLFYEYEIIRGKKLDALAHAGIQDRINRADLRENVMREEAEAQRLRAQQKRIERTAQFGPSQSPIDHFNEAHPLEELLLQYGYQHLGGPHYASPNSQSKGSAVRIWDGERWSSLTSGDADIGQPGSVGTWGDAFDLFVHYEHGGYRTAALKAYAQSAGLSNGSQADDDSDFDYVDQGKASDGPGEGETADNAFLARLFTPVDLVGKPVPARDWHVRDLVPAKTVTLFSGDGGTGKSLCTLQLCVSTALGRSWLGLAVKPGRAIYLSAEDDRDELHRRLAGIAEAENVSLSEIGHLQLASLAGENALMASLSRDGQLKSTNLFNSINQLLKRDRPDLLVLDTLADYFPGNENDRAQARQFIGMLRRLAIEHECAVVMLAHPSLTGINSGSGTSGSTGWNNSVRARLYLSRVVQEGYEANPDARLLSVMKANYSRTGAEISLTWRSGVFVADAPTTGLDRAAASSKAERVFLKLLRDFTSQGRTVNHAGGPTYAPNLFAQNAKAEGCTKKALKGAMDNLLAAGKIKISEYGPPSKRRSFLTLPDASNL